MPTTAEIAAALSALQTSANAIKEQAQSIRDAELEAQAFDAAADAIEAASAAQIGHAGKSVRVKGPAVVAQLVTFLRNRAQSIRDAIILPG